MIRKTDGDRGLTLDRLKEVFFFDPLSGNFTWKKPTCNRVKVGAIVGNPNGQHHQIRIDGYSYKAHRLARLYVYGSWPEGEVDHINRVGTDNRISNLRLADRSENTVNSMVRWNKCGYKGIHFKKKDGRFYARTKKNGHETYGRGYLTPEEAHAEYCRMATEVHGEFWNPTNQQVAEF